jgi:hypothetical protein
MLTFCRTLTHASIYWKMHDPKILILELPSRAVKVSTV